MMNNDKYKVLFMEEGREHIQILNKNLLDLESNTQNLEPVNEIFRAVHTLKGMSSTLGFKGIAQVTHSMENILDEMRSQKRKVSPELMDILLECVDLLDVLIEDVAETGKERSRDFLDLKRRLDELLDDNDLSLFSFKQGALEYDEYQSNIINAGFSQGLNVYWVEIKLQSTCLLKAARSYIIFQTLESLGEIIKSIPHVQDIEEEKFEDTFSVLILTNKDEEEIKQNLESISEVDTIGIQEITPGSMVSKSTTPNSMAYIKEKGVKGLASIKKGDKSSASNERIRSIRVDIERLDILMNLVSELIIIKNTMEGRNENNSEFGMQESMEYLTRITTELHDAVMKVRMVPVSTVFDRFPRVVRDLSKNVGKNIKLNIIGSETEVDRTIIDEIGDPIIHLIRNAIDHGIEVPEERLTKGKDSIGIVDLIAYHDGNNVVIEIRDDGHGIDLNSIVNKAKEKGLVSEGEMESFSEKDKMDLIFQPGFSTTQSVSDISGRGVGMDVVKTKVESLGGIIDIETQLGSGSRFIIRLPLTLSIIQALLVKLGGNIYAIPLNSVQEILHIYASQIKEFRGQEVIPYRENLIPLIRLEKELEIDNEHNGTNEDEIITVVVIKKGDDQKALSIGELMGQQEIVIKSLGKYLSYIKIIAGATILGDGSVALILDINHLI